MISKDNGRSFRQGKREAELRHEHVENAVRQLDLRACLEKNGLQFNAQGFAHCPFHTERTASFRVCGRFWHCFGCNESGELVKFYRKKYNLPYSEALNAICRDFRINDSTPTVRDLERLDLVRIEQYNTYRHYQELLRVLDIQTELYWLAYDLVEYAVQFCGGKTLDNDNYVSAQHALIKAQTALEQAEYNCAQYAKEHPQAANRPRREAHTQRSERTTVTWRK